MRNHRVQRIAPFGVLHVAGAASGGRSGNYLVCALDSQVFQELLAWVVGVDRTEGGEARAGGGAKSSRASPLRHAVGEGSRLLRPVLIGRMASRRRPL